MKRLTNRPAPAPLMVLTKRKATQALFTVRIDRAHVQRVIAERRRLGVGEGFWVEAPDAA